MFTNLVVSSFRLRATECGCTMCAPAHGVSAAGLIFGYLAGEDWSSLCALEGDWFGIQLLSLELARLTSHTYIHMGGGTGRNQKGKCRSMIAFPCDGSPWDL